MRIGLTYDLRDDYLAAGYDEVATAEFDCGETVDAIEAALRSLGHVPQRIGNVHALATALVAGERWDLVFNIAEGLHGYGREAQVPALLDAWQIPYTFTDPLSSALTLHKAYAKRVVRDCGVRTAPFRVCERVADASACDLAYPVFAKPVAEGTGKGCTPASIAHSRTELERITRELLARFAQPVLVETYLPGREFTVGITGSGGEACVVGSMEVVLNAEAEADVYSYLNKARFETRVEYRLLTEVPLTSQVERVALDAWRALGCRDGGRVDIRLDRDGAPCFLEVNPLAGLHPRDSDLPIICNLIGIAYRDLIARIVDSASCRVDLSASARFVHSR